ncbi:regulatory protein RecX [Thioalkalivibrio sp.]|uniref:regulatory protein RecX n=1 Tax=Thioalkalivibrio sp. TaxID=2093813 RepID=UPI003566A114
MRAKSRKAPRDDPDAAYAAGLRLLARREHSGVELGRKLEQRGFAASVAASALGRLRADGYLSEERFARSLALHRADQGYGELRIRAELAHHALSAALVDQALLELDADWVERAMSQARRHFPAFRENGPETARALRHLTQRGFPASVARSALARWAESVQEQG